MLGRVGREVHPGSKATLLLFGANTLTTEEDGVAGINVPSGAELVINSAAESGNLRVKGGQNAAGIGGSQDESGGDITISGSTIVYAYTPGGTGNPAAIGGGANGQAGTIKISGNNENRIVLAPDATATVKLDSASIDLSGAGSDACAFDMSGANVKLLLSGTNVLKSAYSAAGIRANYIDAAHTSTLVIDSVASTGAGTAASNHVESGTLSATGYVSGGTFNSGTSFPDAHSYTW